MIKKNYFPHFVQGQKKPLPEMQEYFEKEREYLLTKVHRASTVFDVGCGIGRTSKELAPFVERIVGIDLDPHMIAGAEENLAGFQNVALLNEDFFAYDPSEQFDLVVATYNTIGGPAIHAFKRQAFLQKMIEHAKTGGHAIATFWSAAGMNVSLQYFASIGVEVLEAKDFRITTDAGVFKRFTKEYIEELVQPLASQYDVHELTKIFYLLDITKT